MEESSEDSDPNDQYMDEEDFREDFRDFFDNITHDDNYGTVGLPLATRDAEALARLCKQSPFGKGDQTLVDTSVRKTWELDAAQFQCQNPSWPAFVTSRVASVAKDLGLQVDTHAEPYKLLLYEEGGLFKAHRDTEKVPGMFATLVICLPSTHTGGDVHIVHGGEDCVLETAPTSAFNLTTLAWYADVSHEVKKVTSGYRLALTYNLVQDHSLPRQTAAALDRNHAHFERLLDSWNREFNYLSRFVYPLDHQYTEANLSLRSLKGKDAAKARYVDQLCVKHGIYWFLGRMTREQGEDLYEDYEEDQETTVLDHIVTPAGVAFELHFSEISQEDLLADHDGMYEDRSPDSEDEGEFTGNESMPSTFRYHDTVLVLLRKDKVISEFLSQKWHQSGSLRAFFEMIHCDHMSNPSDNSAISIALKEIMVQTMDVYINGGSHQRRPSPWDSRRDHREFEEVFVLAADYSHAIQQPELVRLALLNMIKDFSWSSSIRLRQLIGTYLGKEVATTGSDVWAQWFPFTASNEPSFQYANDMRVAFANLRPYLPASSIASFDAWATTQFDEIVNSIKNFSETEVPALLELVQHSNRDTHLNFNLPSIIAKSSTMGVLSFLNQLGALNVEDVDFRESVVKPTYEFLIAVEPPIFQLNMRDLAFKAAPNSSNYHTEFSPTWIITGGSMSFNMFLGVWKKTHELGLDKQAARLVQKGLPEVPEIDSSHWTEWPSYFICIIGLIAMLNQHSHASVSEAARRFAVSILYNSAAWLRKQRPLQPTNWRRSHNIHCKCAHCLQLGRFIKDPAQPVGRFKYPEATRKHLQLQLSYQDYKFETEKTRSPHTLVVYKTQNEFKRREERWKSSVLDMQRQFETFRNNPTSKSVLGEEISVLTNAERLLESPHLGESQPLQPTSASDQNSQRSSGVNEKRLNADIIDLT